MTDKQAFETFKKFRWKDTDGIPVCPHCGLVDHHWILASKQFRCKSCKKKFSVTSGTIFAHRKLPLQDYLGAIAIMTNGAKGYSMIQLSKDLNVQYKTAFVLAHKIREALMNHRNESQMNGEIEIDGTYIGGKIKPENHKDDRIDRRKLENMNGKERVIISIRERFTDKRKGAKRTLTFMAKTENQSDVKAIVERFISRQAVIHADESPAYDLLHAKYKVKRVNHSLNYVDLKINTSINQAESFFSRLKRAYYGQHHHFGINYLAYYANEMAYREDFRRVDNKSICYDILFKALNSPVSPEMCGYWQGDKRK